MLRETYLGGGKYQRPRIETVAGGWSAVVPRAEASPGAGVVAHSCMSGAVDSNCLDDVRAVGALYCTRVGSYPGT